MPDTAAEPAESHHRFNVYRAISDEALDGHIDALAARLDEMATEFERCIEERERRGRGAVALTGAGADYLRDTMVLRQAVPVLHLPPSGLVDA